VVHILPPTVWVCAQGCPVRDRTPGTAPNRFHHCAALGGLTAPLVPEGSVARVRAVVREDYVGPEIVQYDGEGRPVTAIVTERPDGSNDVAVMAPTARMFVED
jgi:hypothetical protein